MLCESSAVYLRVYFFLKLGVLRSHMRLASFEWMRAGDWLANELG